MVYKFNILHCFYINWPLSYGIILYILTCSIRLVSKCKSRFTFPNKPLWFNFWAAHGTACFKVSSDFLITKEWDRFKLLDYQKLRLCCWYSVLMEDWMNLCYFQDQIVINCGDGKYWATWCIYKTTFVFAIKIKQRPPPALHSAALFTVTYNNPFTHICFLS